jgi:type VI secretion system secreted protein Hcp
MGIYMKIEGIPGVAEGASFKDCHAVQSLSWGLSNATEGRMTGTGGAHLKAGKISVGEIQFSKLSDKQSPLFMQNCTQGKNISKVEIVFTGGTEEKEKYGSLLLENVLITSYSLAGGGGDHPGENISLGCAKYTAKFNAINPITGKYEAGAEFSWDISALK